MLNLSKPRILAIDDVPANLLTLGSALSTEFEVEIATSGLDGIAVAKADLPDIILLDIMMPEMDGYEVCSHIKSLPDLCHIPIVFVTGLDDIHSEAKGLSLGAADYITKPINIEIARQRIRNILEREKLRKEVQVQRDQLSTQMEALLKFKTAIEQSPVSVVITDVDANIEYVNPRFSEVTGYTSNEVIGKNPRILQSGQTEKIVYQKFWKELSEGRSWKGTIQNQRKNGELYWEGAQVAPIKNDQGKITHYVGVKTDITQRIQIEEARDEALNRLQKIANRVPGVVYQYRLRTDGSSCFPFSSNLISQIYQVTPESVKEDASAVLSILHPEDLEQVFLSIQKSAENLTPWRQEYRTKLEDGTCRWLYGDALPERESDGSTLWHGFITDITERKQNELELTQYRNHLEALVKDRTSDLLVAKEAAEASSRAKTAFLANMSHELRTPLNGILGMAALATRRATDPKQIDFLGKLSDSADRLLVLINDVLEFSRIEAGSLSLSLTSFKMKEIVEKLIAQIMPFVDKKAMQLVIDIDPALTNRQLFGHPESLAQVLLKLSSNAVKFSSEGCVSVRILLEHETPEKLLLKFEVADQGIGISEEDQKRIFVVFEQSDNSSTRKYGGAGLGLALSQRLVSAMDGKGISAQSELGKGSTFSFSIPLFTSKNYVQV